MAKAALAAGLVDKIGERREFEARLAELGGEGADGEPSSASASRAFVNDTRETAAHRDRSASSPSPARSSTARPGPAPPAGDTIAEEIERGDRRRGQGAGRAGRQPGRVGDGVRAHPPGAASAAGPRVFRSSSRWAMSRRRAAIGSRCRPISSSPSLRPSPARSACSGCFRASRERSRSSASAPTGSRRRRCRASPTCFAAHRPKPMR